MRGLHGLGLVAGREVREALRRKTFWIVVVVLAIGSVLALVVPDLLSDDDAPTYDVGVVGTSESLDAAISSAVARIGGTARLTPVPDAAAADGAVEDDGVDVVVVAGDPPTLVVRSGEHERLVALVQQAIAVDAVTSRLEGAGLSPEEAEQALSAPPAQIRAVDADADERWGASFAVSLVMYLLLLTLMMQAANGTAVEKSNRISEVLLAIVRPGALLFGKVLGIATVGVLTLSATLVPVVVKLGLGGDLPAGLGAAAAGGAAWFVLGLLLYLTLAAALGALVERPEEAGSAVMPLMAVLVATFVVTQGGVDSTLGTVLGYFPLTSPLMEPPRLALGVSSPVEVAASLLLGAGAVLVTGRVASTIYGRAIVRTGRRLKVGDVLRRPSGRPDPI